MNRINNVYTAFITKNTKTRLQGVLNFYCYSFERLINIIHILLGH